MRLNGSQLLESIEKQTKENEVISKLTWDIKALESEVERDKEEIIDISSFLCYIAYRKESVGNA